MNDLERRDFLKKVVKHFFLIISILIVTPFAGFFKSKRLKERKEENFFVTDEDNLPKRGVKAFEVKYHKGSLRIFIVRFNNEFIALSSVCTHLGCSVRWSREKGEFLCPCHGGRYSITGKVIGGPPPDDLHRLPLKSVNGKIYVVLKV